MVCENRLCIYWDERECILDEISLDELGACESCICVSFEEDKLKKMRKNQLRAMEKDRFGRKD